MRWSTGCGGWTASLLRRARRRHGQPSWRRRSCSPTLDEPTGRIYAQRGTRYKEFWIYHRFDPRLPGIAQAGRDSYYAHGYPWVVIATDLNLKPAKWWATKTPTSAIFSVDKVLRVAVRDNKRVDNFTEVLLDPPSAPIPDLAYLVSDLVERARAETSTAQALVLIKEIDVAIGYLDVLKDLRGELATTLSLD